MARRMFVALYPPQSVVDELASVLAEVKQVTPAAEAIRWSRPSQWHLTLAFLPKVPDEYLSRIGAALALLAETWEAGPPLAVSGAGKFGTATLWWALRPDPVAERWLSQLGRAVRRGCRGAGAETEDSRWRPHITIGRVRRDAPAGVTRAWTQALKDVGSAEWSPQELVLVTSVTGPTVEHTVTGRWALSG